MSQSSLNKNIQGKKKVKQVVKSISHPVKAESEFNSINPDQIKSVNIFSEETGLTLKASNKYKYPVYNRNKSQGSIVSHQKKI